MERLAELEDNSVDCIITDPPYGVSYRSLSHKLRLRSIANDGKEAYDLLDKALSIAVGKLKKNSHVYIFTNWQAYPSMRAVAEKYLTLKNVLVWDKGAGTRGDLKGKYSFRHELIMFFHNGRWHLNHGRDSNILAFAKLPSNHMQHPTEKPVALLEYLISKSTQEGETVLDMFMGVGSTCLAAKRLKRQYIGIELEQTWFTVAQARLA